jgi:hypothetical protein
VGKEEVRLLESLRKSELSSDQLGTLIEEEDQRHILIIGGLGIFLPHILTEANVCISCEEVMQQESEEEAMGKNVCEAKILCTTNATEE